MMAKNLAVKTKVLIIQTAFIGDVILATSLIEIVSRELPDSKIDFFLRKGNESLIANNPHIDQVYIWDKKRKIKSLFENLFSIRKTQYDLVINIQRFFNSGLMTLLSRAKIKIGFDKNPLSLFFTHKIQHKIPHIISNSSELKILHEVERNAQLFYCAHSQMTNNNSKVSFKEPIRKAITPPRLFPSLKDREHTDSVVKNLFSEALLKKEDLLIMAPTSVWYTKALHPKMWQKLISRLPHYKILCIGGPSDFESIEEITNNFSHAHNLSGKLSLLQSAYLMQKAKWVLVNDSAPLHLASSVNANTLAFFCSTIKDFGYYPLSTHSHILEVNNLACRPCGLHGKKACPKEHFKCSNEIDLSRALDIIEYSQYS